MAWVAGCHHVLGIKHLLGQLRYGQCAVLLGAAASKRGESRHEKMETGKGDHVNSKFSQISVQL